MKNYKWVLILLPLIIPLILSSPQIACKWIYYDEIPNYNVDTLFSPDQGCLLVYYNQTNSHAALCSEGLFLWNNGTFPTTGGVISCKIIADQNKLLTYGFNSTITFPIVFQEYKDAVTVPFEGLDLYLYYPSDSHVSLQEVTSPIGTYNGIKLSSDFNFLEFVNTTTGISPSDIQNTTMLLYLETDSHIADPLTNDAPIKFILHNKTGYSVETNIEVPDIIVDTATVNITDKYLNIPLQYCYYRIQEGNWTERECYTYSFNLSTFPNGPCPIDDYCKIESLVINRIGDVFYNYTLVYSIRDPLDLKFQKAYQSEASITNETFDSNTNTFYRTYLALPIQITLDIRRGNLEIPFTINVISKNTIINDLYIYGDLEYINKISENLYPGRIVITCGDQSGEVVHLTNLLPGTQIDCVAKIYPATVGSYNAKLNFNWYYTVNDYSFNYTYVKDVRVDVFTIGSTLLSIATMDEPLIGGAIVLIVNILLVLIVWI